MVDWLKVVLIILLILVAALALSALFALTVAATVFWGLEMLYAIR